jgi:hypothetical protein
MGNDGNNTKVRITHAKITKNPKIQTDRVIAMATRRCRESGGDEGGSGATIAFGMEGNGTQLKK